VIRHALAVLSLGVLLTGACTSTSTTKAASPTTRSPSYPTVTPISTPSSPTSEASTTTAAGRPCAPTTAPGAKVAGGKDVNPAGDIPDNQAFVPYSPPGAEYTVKVPEGWARTEKAPAVSFTDRFNAIRVELVASPQAPSVETARADEVPRMAATVPCFKGASVSTVTRKAGAGVLVTYQADGLPDPVTGKVLREDVERYEFWRNGTEAVLTLSAPAGSDNVDPWKLVTDSFTWR
jgi:hypothetical protein